MLLRIPLFKHFKNMSCNCRFSTCRFGKCSSTDKTCNFTTSTAEYNLFVFAVIALYAQESTFWSQVIIFHFILLLELELLCPETGSLVGFLACCTPVSEPNTFCGFVSTGHLWELSAVSYTFLSFLLPCNMGHGWSLAFLDPFYYVFTVGLTEWAVSFEPLWNFHFSTFFN